MVSEVYLMPKEVKVVQTLDDSRLEEYNEGIKSYSETARKTLGKFKSIDGVLAGSNKFMVVEMIQKGLLPEGIDYIVRREDLEEALEMDSNFLKGKYVDVGLTLRTNGDSYKPNDLLAKQLYEDLSSRGIDLGNGKLISLNDLRIEENSDSAYGLVFRLNDSATKDSVLDLDSSKWNWGLNNGLARACLDSCHNWSFNVVSLDVSSDNGRVVGLGWKLKNLYSEKNLIKVFKDANISGIYNLIKDKLK